MAGIQRGILGLGTFIFGALYGYFGKKFLEGSVLVTTSSSLYTETLSWCMVFCGAVLLVQGIRQYAADRTSSATVSGPPLARLFPFVVIAAAYAWSLEILGFIPSSVLAGAAFMFIMGERRAARLLLIPGIFTLILYFMFTKLLFVQLPDPAFIGFLMTGGSHVC